MAGFVGNYQFHIDTPDVAHRIRQATTNARVVHMQLDCDELDAALWGFENYKKGGQEVQTRDDDGSLQYFPTIEAAFSVARSTPTIWKVSWTDSSTGERVRMIRRGGFSVQGRHMVKGDVDVWVYEPIVFPEVSSSERR